MRVQHRLASVAEPVGTSDSCFDCLVVGSGFGGAVMAARLAPHLRGRRLALLERGQDYTAQTLPSNASAAIKAIKSSCNPLGLFDFGMHRGADTLGASALGGTSRICERMTLQVQTHAFETSQPDAQHRMRRLWPNSLNAISMQNHYGEALSMLDRTDTHSAADEPQTHGLCTNYLHVAKQFGCKFLTQCEVISFSPSELPDYRFQVLVQQWHNNGEHWVSQTRKLHTRMLVLSAGVLGTTAIMSRSAALGFMPFSPWLGTSIDGSHERVSFSCVKAPYQPRIVARVFRGEQPPVACKGELSLGRNSALQIHWHSADIDSSQDRHVRSFLQRVAGYLHRNRLNVAHSYRDGSAPMVIQATGGCRMGVSFDEGVCDDVGRVFKRSGGAYTGLYINDASICCSAMVNPALAIAALAERSAQQIVETDLPILFKKQVSESGKRLQCA